MSTHTPADDRTDHTTTADAPDTYALASELGVDAALLARFVDEHPSPTAPIVLGWAHDHGELPEAPEHLRDDVEAWVAERNQGSPGLGLTPDDLRETRLRALSLRSILGGEAE